VAGRRRRRHLGEAGDLARVLRRRDVGRDALLEYQPAVETRRFPVGEQIGRQIEIRIAVGEHGRCDPRHVQPRQLDAVLEVDPRVAAERGGRPHRVDPVARRQFAEILGDEVERAHDIDVAGDRQRSVARVIVAAEKRVDFVELDRLQVGDLADRGPVVRVIGRKQRRQERHRREPVGPVLVVLPPFVQHHVALVVEFGLGQRRQQISHPIGFHPQRQLQRAGRHYFPVVGAVGVGRSVQRGAGTLQRLKEAAIVVLGSLEHQMLEQVSEPGFARTLVLRADVVPEVDGGDRAGVIFMKQHVEPVVERVLREGDVHGLKLPQVSIDAP
jgi:hypothetical protein